jgi:hypothetical protein
MLSRLNPEDLQVTSFETASAPLIFSEYTPDCCTDDGSGCKTGPEVTCNSDEYNCATVETQEAVDAREAVEVG